MTVIVVCSLGLALGLAGLIIALRGHTFLGDSGELSTTNRPMSDSGRRLNGPLSAPDGHLRVAKLGLPLVCALVVGILTRWPVAAVLSAVAAVGLPGALRSTSVQDATRRTEAVAVWTELLRDTLTASAGLAQAIVATAGIAPPEIQEPAGHLADRIMSGVSMDDALRLFASDLDDPSAEDVVCALRLAATSRAQRLVDLLGALADSTRDEVTMRLRVEASRASTRSGVRTVICFSIGFVALLAVVAQSYLAPFRSITGQLVLVVVGGCYVAGLTLMVRLVRPAPRHRPRREAVRA